jgi:NAD(P)-dependent dehydrogenase (short-subunit alcohol dehydrogenase family)
MTETSERDLAGMVTVITGAGSGVGRATAVALAGAGALPVLVGRRREALDETAALTSAGGGVALVLPADVSDEAAVNDAFTQAATELGGIDAVILSAGIGRYGPVESYPLADWETTIATNLTGPLLCAKAAIPLLRQRGGGTSLPSPPARANRGTRNSAPTAHPSSG